MQWVVGMDIPPHSVGRNEAGCIAEKYNPSRNLPVNPNNPKGLSLLKRWVLERMYVFGQHKVASPPSRCWAVYTMPIPVLLICTDT
jgi:hypothetical protein